MSAIYLQAYSMPTHPIPDECGRAAGEAGEKSRRMTGKFLSGKTFSWL
jgi:hypothetical protein